jgi:hypothetical protein
MKKDRSKLIGNLIVIFDDKYGANYDVVDNILLTKEQKSTVFQAEVSYLAKHNSQEIMKLLLPYKEEIGRFYWSEFSDAAKRDGVEFVSKLVPYAAISIIAMMGSGNYIFDLTGHYPYPHMVSDFVFGRYREYIETLPIFRKHLSRHICSDSKIATTVNQSQIGKK